MQTSLLKPKIIAVESLGESHAKVVMEPFERGYGHTLGNALRRVLLSSMIGYAPTEVTIAGVVHEYSTLDGVQEDVVNLLLNLKGVVFKLHNRDEVTVTLRKEGEGVVTAGDIELAHDCEVIQSVPWRRYIQWMIVTSDSLDCVFTNCSVTCPKLTAGLRVFAATASSSSSASALTR